MTGLTDFVSTKHFQRLGAIFNHTYTQKNTHWSAIQYFINTKRTDFVFLYKVMIECQQPAIPYIDFSELPYPRDAMFPF